MPITWPELLTQSQESHAPNFAILAVFVHHDRGLKMDGVGDIQPTQRHPLSSLVLFVH